MSDDKTTKVTLTLRSHVAERLRRMCHTKGVTASSLIDRWVLQNFDEKGDPVDTRSGKELFAAAMDRIRQKL